MAANLLLEKSAWDRTPEETVRRALGKVLLKPDRLAEVTQLLASRDTASDAKIADERHDKLANAARFSAERWAINLAAPEVDPGAVVSQFRIQFHKHLVRSIDESETPWAASMRLQGSEYADASFSFDGRIAALDRDVEFRLQRQLLSARAERRPADPGRQGPVISLIASENKVSVRACSRAVSRGVGP